ncbi:Nudix hydrolase 2 [Vitis vinifera]|uniref:Nudix hydrolase 2 n=1 Tax=Vitis vinifera TaxID=29760 RepID=A0A438IES6_VITVI|nr:Nudix hydrolase 2 [Vitis vinifera]
MTQNDQPCVHSGVKARAVIPHLTRIMSGSTTSMMVDEQRLPENNVQQIELLTGTEDSYGGVRVEIKNRMDSSVFGDVLRASISQWRQKGTKGVWIKLPIQHANLVEAAVKEGFWYHHAEPDYLMLVLWIPKTAHTLPANASHRVGIGAFVINSKREVLVVQENSGRFKGTGVWKLPTGVVNEGEDICTAAIREVEEETGIKTEFVEILAFRQSHKAFFTKSDLFFVCMLQPLSTEIQKQEEELEAAQWMAMEEYAAQPFVKKNPLFDSIANICLAKKDMKYTGFSPFSATSSSGKTNILYFNNQDLKQPLSSGNQA